MLTPTDIMNTICKELEAIFKGWTLPNKDGLLQEVRIFPQYIPQPSGITVADKNKRGIENYAASDYEANFPGVIVKLGEITDNDERKVEMNQTEVRLLFGVYDESPECEAWRDVLSMMERVRQKWLKERIIARRFFVQMPLKTRLIEADTYPLYFGEMNVELEAGRPRGGMDYVYRSYVANG